MKVLTALILLSVAGSLFSPYQKSETAPQGNGRVTKIELGSKQGQDEHDLEVSQTNEFAPETPRIICRWEAEGFKTATVVRGVWIAEDTNGVMEKETKLNESRMDVPVISNLTGIFILRARGPWDVGKYRLDLYLGDELSKSVSFVIKEK